MVEQGADSRVNGASTHADPSGSADGAELKRKEPAGRSGALTALAIFAGLGYGCFFAGLGMGLVAVDPAAALLLGGASGVGGMVAMLVWLVRAARAGRRSTVLLATELLCLVLLPAAGLLINQTTAECARRGSESRPFASPEIFSVYLLYALSVVAYAISRRRRGRLGAAAELMVVLLLLSGIAVCALLAAQLQLLAFIALLIPPLGVTMLAPYFAATLFLVALVRRLRDRGREARADREAVKPAPSWIGALLACGVGLWALVQYLVTSASSWFGVVTRVCNNPEWLFATRTPPPGGHYLCTVAARGYRWLVRPSRLGRRGGQTIVVNRQLAVANAFEDLLHARWPRLGRLARRIYDRLALPVCRYLRHPLPATIVYLVMKPFEWLFYIVLLLADRDDPETRIDRMYR